jgi:XTP/dITP diphosphohydrolase
VCAAAAVWPDGREEVVRGACEGVIASGPRGTNGFGYDPIVVPADGDGRTFGEMSDEEKLAISHRSRAFRALAALL